MSFIMTCISRKFEFEADNFSVKLGYGDKLIDALKKLFLSNLQTPVDDYIYSMFNHSHPTLLQRFNNIKTQNDKIK